MTPARAPDTGSIPVVDISPLRNGSNPTAVAHALLEASQNLGFIYVNGHGIPDQTIEIAREKAFEFFRSREVQKRRYAITPKHRGWLARGGAKMQDDAEADLKESFLWGYQDKYGCAPSDHELRGPNLWPDFVPEMESSAMAYFKEADRLARDLLNGFAIGLNLDPDFFLRNCQTPLSRASFVYYPKQPESSGQALFGVGPHTDFGLLTVLSQDDVGGLQVKNLAGEWIEAPPIPGTMVVNVGDLLERWTDCAFRSTPHRVINTSGRERLSLVLAFDPDPETMIDAREVIGNEKPPKQPPISCGDYLVWRFGRAFSYRDSVIK